MTLTIANPLNSVANHRAHYLASLWQITRRDGTQLRLTSHSTNVQFDAGAGKQIFEPTGAPNITAMRREEGMKDQEEEMFGAVTSDKITYQDLEAGLYREAEILQFLVDPRFPWGGAFYTARFWITDTEFDGENWRADLMGATGWLSGNFGRVFGRSCSADVFDTRCGLSTTDETWYRVENVRVLAASQDADEPRRVFAFVFADVPSVGPEEDEYKHGTLTWTTGPNTGLVSEIKEYAHTATPSQRDVEIHLPTPYAIGDNDQCTIVTGCDRRRSTCATKFGNIVNYRGWPFMPGTDDLLQTPDAPA